MQRLLRDTLSLGTWLLILTGALYAQIPPKISPGGVVRSPDYKAAIGRGSIFAVFGAGLGPDTPAQVTAFPLQPDLAGTRLEIQTSTGIVPALPVFVNSGQIAAVLPSTISAGNWTIRVVRNGISSAAEPISVVDAAPGLFSLDQSGSGDSVAQNPTRGHVESVLNTPSTPALAGGIITLWGTGLGAISAPDVQAPPAKNIEGRIVTVEIAGVLVTPLYAGRSPCCSGLDQIVFAMPGYVPGCSTGVRVHAGSAVSNTVRLYTAASAACDQELLVSDSLFIWKRITPPTANTGPGTADHLIEVEWRNTPATGDSLEVVELSNDGSVQRALTNLHLSSGKLWTGTLQFDRAKPAAHLLGVRFKPASGTQQPQLFQLGSIVVVGTQTCRQTVDEVISALVPLDAPHLARLQIASLASPAITPQVAQTLADLLLRGQLVQEDQTHCVVNIQMNNLTSPVEFWRSPLGEWFVASW